MNKQLKSWMYSLIVVYIMFLAVKGIIRLFWNTDDDHVLIGRVMLTLTLLFVFSFIYIIGIYHIVGPHKVDNYYGYFIIIIIIVLVAGFIFDIIFDFRKSKLVRKEKFDYQAIFKFYKDEENKKLKKSGRAKLT